MKLSALNQFFSNTDRSQKSSWNWHAGDQQYVTQGPLESKEIQHSSPPKLPNHGDKRPKLCVEDIKVSVDRRYMYCKGCVRSQDTRSKSKVVVAVEWLDEDRQALNTDWKRIEFHLDSEAAPQLTNSLQPFTVKAPLDRRAKWVKAYAFSGNN